MPLLDDVMEGLGGDGIESIGRSLGLDAKTTATALSAAVPMLLTAMSRNAADPSGAESLLGALERDHDGGIYDDVAGYLGGGGAGATDGEAILGHVLGDRQRRASTAVGNAAGIDAAQAMRLLAMAAPFVMGALGRARRRGDIQPGRLGAYFESEQDVLRQRSPGAMSMLSQVLDSDGDGSILDDISKFGSGLLGSLKAWQ